MSGVVDYSGPFSVPPERPRSRGARLVRGLVFVGVGLFSGFAVVRTVPALMASDFLPVHNVVVEGVRSERIAEIVAYAAIADGTALFAIDSAAVKARVEEHPFVREATVRRLPPDTVEISVIERIPFALLVSPKPYVLDEAGVPFKRFQVGDETQLPVITGVGEDGLSDASAVHEIDLAFDVIRAHRDLGEPAGRLDEVNISDTGARLVLAGGVVVELGNQQVMERLRRLGEVTARLRKSGREPELIYLNDARRPERVAVRLRAQAEMPAKSGG